MDPASASPTVIPTEILIGFLILAITTSTWIIKRAMRPIETAVRPGGADTGLTVLEASREIRVDMERLSNDMESLRGEVRTVGEKQDRTEQWVTLIDTRIGTIDDTQTQLAARITRLETIASKERERVDLLRTQLPWPNPKGDL